MKKIKNGFYITVEGIDGSGKSSIVNFLSSELSNRDFNVIKTREPGGTPLGICLRNLIVNADITQLGIDQSGSPTPIDSKAECLLFAADRAQHLYSVIKPALSKDSIIISDRGADSSLAYQGYGKGLDLKLVSAINDWILANTKPDLVIYLKLDYQSAIKRVIERGEKISAYEKKGPEFFDRVINGFNEIFSSRAQDYPGSVLEIDASQSVENVKQQVLDKVLKILMLKELS